MTLTLKSEFILYLISIRRQLSIIKIRLVLILRRNMPALADTHSKHSRSYLLNHKKNQKIAILTHCKQEGVCFMSNSIFVVEYVPRG